MANRCDFVHTSSVVPSWESMRSTRSTQAASSCQLPTLNSFCCRALRCCSTSSYRNCFGLQNSRRISPLVFHQSTRVISLRVLRIRGAGGARRHHRRRADDGFAPSLRSNEKSREGSEKMQQLRKNSGRRDDHEDNVVLTMDMDELKHRAADAVAVVTRAAERWIVTVRRAAGRSADELTHFAKATARDGDAAWRDLRTSVRIQKDKPLVVSVRRSSLEFAGRAVVGCLLVVVLTRVFFGAVRRYQRGWEDRYRGSEKIVRDRSLGGREISLATKDLVDRPPPPLKRAGRITQASRGPLDLPLDESRSEKELLKTAGSRGGQNTSTATTRRAPRLPGWWPGPDLPPASSMASRQRAEEEARLLVKGIMQKRQTGLDFSAEDTLLLRQLCKGAGVEVKFDTNNARDSFYRAAVNFVLSACQRAPKWSIVDFGSEGGVGFIAGLASNIGLESDRAATMVNAAVAARTRAGLLQARALHMQSKPVESKEELLKLIRLHDCFPPDPNSAEMEMVAQGLGSHFDDQGKFDMLQAYEDLGGAKTKQATKEALGLAQH